MMDKLDSQRPAARVLQTIRNLLLAISVYIIITATLQFFFYGSFTATRKAKGSVNPTGSTPILVDIDDGSKSSHGYSRLRPDSLVVANDAYMGTRPHADTHANFTRLLEVCRGSFKGLERMKEVYDCMKYLTDERDDYYYLPSETPPSQGYPAFVSSSLDNVGTCNGPIVPYHIWWSGKCTWRVELFIKSYFHSQNLPCSRLNLWLDVDVNPNAVDDMMQDPGFARFIPLVHRGDLKLREWSFPSRVLLKAANEGEGNGKIIHLDDGVYIDEKGNEWLEFSTRKMTFLPVAVSDAVRFVVLHYEGGVYCDMDNVLLRDLRPLLIPENHGFAERWGWFEGPWDYNTAIMSLHPNSSLSQHFLKGAVKMGINFHPYIIGRLVYKDGRGQEFTMFEDGFFDPIWGQFNTPGVTRCTVPCWHSYGQAFLGKKDAIPLDWMAYEGPQIEEIDGGVSGDAAGKDTSNKERSGWFDKRKNKRRASTSDLESEVEKRAPHGFKDGYDIEKDPYPPNNRTLEHFFRGAYAYHIHNQWAKHPEPNSWLDVVRKTHDGFLSGNRVNMYGEKWNGPKLTKYDPFPEFD
ncbi:hypothetical protein H072_1742 [Dactylellina haptotyla CBS 200.50]|uniref:Uncharacterized protein n=1 Tax=Dactylellina haptotyla (strain CBS 200.50) TaxID=1284197 RepID=S8C959_DACHA|nr:hypothetical protein H072_1742 [Dactylellina haptotyla CBS 200.50]